MGGAKEWRLDKIKYEAAIDRRMLRFRPIAPRPASGGSVLCVLPANQKNLSNPTAKKYGGARKNTRRRSNKESAKKDRKEDSAEKATLQLFLPEKNAPELEGSAVGVVATEKPNGPTLLSGKINGITDNLIRFGFGELDRTVISKVLDSWVTVEFVTDTCTDGGRWLGRTDAERRMNLEADTCPGFISDGYNWVGWVNDAYRAMIAGGEWWPEMRVWLVMRDGLEMCRMHAALTCRVKLQYFKAGGKCSQQTMPCDAWRMDDGGFAWRLDVEAALSLGR